MLIYGSGKERIRHTWDSSNGRGEYSRPWEGLASEITRRFQQTGSEGMQEHYRAYMSEQPCPQCHGAKLRPESLAVTVGGMSINDTCALTIDQTYTWACTLAGETDGWYGQFDRNATDGITERVEQLDDYRLAGLR